MSRRYFASQASAQSAEFLSFLLKCNEVYSWGNFRFERGVKYIDFRDLVMLDWDPSDEPDGVHYTITSVDEVDTLLSERVNKCPDEFWLTYLTPSGGVHAFLLSHKYTPKEAEPLMRELHCDLLYVELCQPRQRFGVRISPKVGRVGDYIASFYRTYGSGIPLEEHVETMKLKESFIKGAKFFN